MASESRDDRSLAVDVPADLEEWLEDRAGRLDVDRDELVVQVLGAYQAAATLDGDVDADESLDLDASALDGFEDAVEAALDDRIEDELSGAVEEVLGDRIESIAGEVEDAVVDELVEDVGDDLEAIEADFQAKIEDVRDRVVQVKKETDAKAPADHAHDGLEAVPELEDTVDGLRTELEGLRHDLTDRFEANEERRETMDERLEDVEEKLRRVAWVVSDLREEVSGRDAHEQAVERIKRAAAQEGVASAECGRCGERVHVGLLTTPECPHCQATVSDVRPEGGLFRTRARLVPAAQLESGAGPDEP